MIRDENAAHVMKVLHYAILVKMIWNILYNVSLFHLFLGGRDSYESQHPSREPLPVFASRKGGRFCQNDTERVAREH